jgi:flagellar hook-length control protein FliK
MTIENFFAARLQVPVSKTGQPGVAAGENALLSKTINFFDFMLARTLKDQAALDNQVGTQVFKTENTLLQSPNPMLDKEAGLRISDLIAANPEIAKEVQEFSTGIQDEISQTLELNKKAFDDLLRPVESADVLAARQAEINKKIPTLAESFQLDAQNNKILMSRLKSLLAKLENVTGQQIQLANLQPAQIEGLKAKIKALLAQGSGAENNPGNNPTNTGEKTTADLIDPAVINEIALGLVQIVQPLAAQNKELAVTADSLTFKKATDNPAPAALAARLNKLTPGAPGEDLSGNPISAVPESENFEQILKSAGSEKILKDVANLNIKPQADSVTTGPATPSILDVWPFSSAGSLLGSLNWGRAMFDGYGGLATPAAQISGPASMTSLVTQAHSAIYPHPSVKIIAKALQKMAASGEEKTITLQMDPPELGRVKVQMVFGKDKTVKATILAEKPETFAMLQRDAHILERALEEAGIDSAGSSLNFEMAGDGQNFSNNGKHDGYHSGKSLSGDPDTEILETTMTWNVDPETGYTRYDILV